jgi:hypothetical protein
MVPLAVPPLVSACFGVPIGYVLEQGGKLNHARFDAKFVVDSIAH